ncbi:MAG: helix-turn-helix domain-containing protein [Chloroflexi bacterium]|nr:helix-turn-helix domain-containing protein [Chloroflexota bacterium]
MRYGNIAQFAFAASEVQPILARALETLEALSRSTEDQGLLVASLYADLTLLESWVPMMMEIIDEIQDHDERTPAKHAEGSKLPKGFLSLQEASRLLRLAPTTLRVQTNKGVLRAIKLGALWATTPEWVEEYRTAHLRSRNGRVSRGENPSH